MFKKHTDARTEASIPVADITTGSQALTSPPVYQQAGGSIDQHAPGTFAYPYGSFHEIRGSTNTLISQVNPSSFYSVKPPINVMSPLETSSQHESSGEQRHPEMHHHTPHEFLPSPIA